ncbi:MAG: hypothetical protein L0Y78_05750 [candidate division NC10 bacterium]|nr:hypothetical protein [candidate division NC10 bacterium]
MKHRKLVALTMVVVGLAFTALWGPGPVFSAEKVKIALNRSQGVQSGSGEAVIADSILTIQAKDLKPNSVYSVWFVNMKPKEAMAGVGTAPYAFKTDQQGKATFKATLAESPVGKWQMLVIVRHPTGDPKDMMNKEDALWAQLM